MHAYTSSRPSPSSLAPSSIRVRVRVFVCRESVRALNYPVVPALESRLHEIFLRYRAPTMGGPQVATHLEDLDAGQLISQSEFMRWGRQPIWSGGTYWPNYVSSPRQNDAPLFFTHTLLPSEVALSIHLSINLSTSLYLQLKIRCVLRRAPAEVARIHVRGGLVRGSPVGRRSVHGSCPSTKNLSA